MFLNVNVSIMHFLCFKSCFLTLLQFSTYVRIYYAGFYATQQSILRLIRDGVNEFTL